MKRNTSGFTIVELLVVIVVIGILAAVTIVAYNGVQQKAHIAVLQSDLSNAVTSLGMVNAQNGTYPVDLTSAGLKASPGTTYQYSYTGADNSYCLAATNSNITYVSSTANPTPAAGNCTLARVWANISSGGYHTCAVDSNGKAYCWGYNSHGQLGNSSTTNSSVPVAVVTGGALSGKTIKSISAAANHTCAIASDNQAYCWGRGEYGQLGNSSTTNSSVPVAVVTGGALSGKTIKSISASSSANHTCAIASDNQAYCWGMNHVGQVGGGVDNNLGISVPVAVVTSGVLSGKTVVSITTGNSHTCAIASDDKPYCWGYADTGQFGNGGVRSNVPTAVTTSGALSGKTVVSVGSGSSNVCVVASGMAYCWGGSWQDEQGRNGSTTVSAPTPIAVDASGVLSGKTLTKIASGNYSHCVLDSSGKAYCWGGFYGGYEDINYDWWPYTNNHGELGNNTTTSSAPPAAVYAAGALSGKVLVAISTGGQKTCALDSIGGAYCWGYNVYGQLGNGLTSDSPVPVPVALP